MAFSLGAGISALMLFSSPQHPCVDVYYHSRVAERIGQHGLTHEFPWARETILANHFSDKELLFHLLLVPFVGTSPILGAKVFACLLSGAVFALLYTTLRAGRCLFPGWWAMLLVASGPISVYRLSMPRPHVFSLLMLLLTVLGLLRRWHYLFLILGAVYALGYSVPHLMVFVIVLYNAGMWFAGEERDWKPLAFALAGLLIGFLVHPNCPNNFYLWYVQTVLAPLYAWGVSEETLHQGAELISPSGRMFLFGMSLPVLCVAGSLLGYLWKTQRPSKRTWSFLCIWFFFLGLTMLSVRFAEYFVPFSLLLAASASSDLIADVDWGKWFERCRAARSVIPVTLILFTACSGLYSVLSAQAWLKEDLNTSLPEAAEWIRDNLEPGEVVFHTEWGDFPQLFHYAPQQHYLVALDPIFMYAKDPSKWRLWEDISSGRRADTPHLVRAHFNSRFMVLYLPRRKALDRRLRRSPEAKQVYRNGSYVIYQLREVSGLFPELDSRRPK